MTTARAASGWTRPSGCTRARSSLSTYSEWTEPLRREFEDRYVEALNELAARKLQAGAFEEALMLFKSLEDIDGYSDAAAFGIMRCHVGLNDPGTAARHYRRYRQLLHDELDEEPSERLTALYREAGRDSATTRQLRGGRYALAGTLAACARLRDGGGEALLAALLVEVDLRELRVQARAVDPGGADLLGLRVHRQEVHLAEDARLLVRWHLPGDLVLERGGAAGAARPRCST